MRAWMVFQQASSQAFVAFFPPRLAAARTAKLRAGLIQTTQ
jgi:hypothetical protein